MKLTNRLTGGIVVFAVALVLFFVAVPSIGAAGPTPVDDPVVITFFWGDGCPHCAEEEVFLEELGRRYPNVEIRAYEVWYSPQNQAIFQETADEMGFEPSGVPTTIIGDRIWVGFSDGIGAEIEGVVAARSSDDPSAGVSRAQTTSDTLTLPLIGTVDLGAQSLWASTAIIAFVDGFNPCSVWVLSILIALTLHTGSRRKILIIGLIYITVTAAVYVLFIAGLFTMLSIVSFLGWIQAAVSALALVFAVVNIKDYFWYKEGLSFTIADEKKSGIYKRIRRVMSAEGSLWRLAAATVALGVGVSLVEFSCTAGFPVIWANLVAAQSVTPTTFALLLLLYMVIYQIDEFGIFLIAVVTLQATRLEEKHGRILKLVGGVLMLALAAVMLIKPALMNNLLSSLIIFAAAFAGAMVILVTHRVILPRLGVRVGSEFAKRRVLDES